MKKFNWLLVLSCQSLLVRNLLQRTSKLFIKIFFSFFSAIVLCLVFSHLTDIWGSVLNYWLKLFYKHLVLCSYYNQNLHVWSKNLYYIVHKDLKLAAESYLKWKRHLSQVIYDKFWAVPHLKLVLWKGFSNINTKASTPSTLWPWLYFATTNIFNWPKKSKQKFFRSENRISYR